MIERQFAEIKKRQERYVWLFWLDSVWYRRPPCDLPR